jgi:putative hemolysin
MLCMGRTYDLKTKKIKMEFNDNFAIQERRRLSKIESFRIIFTIFLVLALLIIISSDPVSALMNPSAVYCEELGYEYITINTEKGVRGLCVLPNDRIVSAWWFLEGKVAQEYSYCKKAGHEIKTVRDSETCKRIFTDECAVCILEDGTEVEVSELMNLSFVVSVCGDDFCTSGMENFKICPEDCPSGEQDMYCDGVTDGKCDPDCVESGEYDPDCPAAAPILSFVPIALAVVIILVAITVMVILLRRHKREE